MVVSIARQSVIIKCLRQKSVMLGNYEFYYGAGLLNKCFGLKGTPDMKPQELFDYIIAQLDNISPQNEQEEYLVKIIKLYEPLENYDQQMVELFKWGETEENLWQVNIS